MDNENMSKQEPRIRRIRVIMAKRLFDEGLTVPEVCAEMNLSESVVRALKKTIDEAEEK